MVKEKSMSTNAAELRRMAEEHLKAKAPEAGIPRTDDETLRLLHELEVHQIELEMQNAELRQARDEVETTLEKYTDLYDFAPVGYFTFDRDGIILAANLTGARLLGVERSRLIGRRFSQFVAAKNRSTLTAFLGKVIISQSKESCEVTLTTEGDSPLFLHIEAVVDTSGEEIFAAVGDVTDRNRVEEIIINLNDELESRVKERTVELERMNKELEDFCYSISHEFRAPIARLEGFGATMIEIAREYGAEPMIHCSRRIVAAGNRMRTVIDALLTMNRVSRAEMHLQDINLSDMANQIVSGLLEKTGKRSINISIAPDIKAVGDRDLMEICLKNLLKNAFKYSSKTPAASVEFGQKIIDGEKVYFVRDNGVGFKMEFAKNIFVPFCKLHKEDEFEGTGVGLATVHRIIEKHKGRIRVEAKPGEGATFFFTL